MKKAKNLKQEVTLRLKNNVKVIIAVLALLLLCTIAFIVPAYSATMSGNVVSRYYSGGGGGTCRWRVSVDYSTSASNTAYSVSGTIYEEHCSNSGFSNVRMDKGTAYAVSWGGVLMVQSKTGSHIETYRGKRYKLGTFSRTVSKTHSAQSLVLKGQIIQYGDWGGTSTAQVTISVPARPAYNIYYNANGGSGVPGTGTKWYDEAYTVPGNTPTRTGYTFTGYRISETGYYPLWPGGQISAGSNGNYTCVAQWSANTYNLVVDPTGGTLEGSNFGNYAGTSNVATVGGSNNGTPSAKLQYGTSNYCDLGTATRTGYTFNGFWTAKSGGTKLWNADGTNNTAATSYWNSSRQWIYTGNVTVYAQWIEHTATVTYDANGHGTNQQDTIRYTQPFRAGQVTEQHPASESSHTLLFTPFPGTSVSWQSQAGACNWIAGNPGPEFWAAYYDGNRSLIRMNQDSGDATVKYYAQFDDPGYVFKEWNTKADGTGTSYAPGALVKDYNEEPSDITLYAIWQHPGTITITKQWNDDLTGQEAENRKPPVIKIEGERVPQQ